MYPVPPKKVMSEALLINILFDFLSFALPWRSPASYFSTSNSPRTYWGFARSLPASKESSLAATNDSHPRTERKLHVPMYWHLLHIEAQGKRSRGDVGSLGPRGSRKFRPVPIIWINISKKVASQSTDNVRSIEAPLDSGRSVPLACFLYLSSTTTYLRSRHSKNAQEAAL